MPTDEAVLLDTHVVLWWKAGGRRLSAAAKARIADAPALLISPITCWEIAMLVHKERILLDRPVATWIVDLLAGDRIQLAPLTASVAVAAADLRSFHGDTADRFLVATAEVGSVALLSKDRLIRDYARTSRALIALW